MYKKNEATGLPEPLHEGGYFEITRASTEGRLRLYYRIKRVWWFDKKVGWVLLTHFDDHFVYREAERLLRLVVAQQEQSQMEKLIGKYPPKRLGKEGE